MVPSDGRQGTRTVPDLQRGGVFDGKRGVTALLECGTDTIHALSPRPRNTKYYTVGSAPDNDIAIASAYVSAHHGRFVQTETGLRFTDQSKNGTYFRQKRMRKPFDVGPGDVFYLGARTHGVLALSKEMQASYPTLAAILGFEDEHILRGGETPLPSDLIVAANGSAHLLITGEPHCDQDRLARIIHEISPFRDRPFVVLNTGANDDGVLNQAATFLLDLGAGAVRMDSAFVGSLFDATTRVIVLAESVDAAVVTLGWRVNTMNRVWVRPLSRRKQAIPRLLDGLFAERSSTLRIAAMTAHNQEELVEHRWRENFVSLREAADRLVAIASNDSMRQAAGVLGLHPNTLQSWYKDTVHLTLPLLSPGGQAT